MSHTQKKYIVLIALLMLVIVAALTILSHPFVRTRISYFLNTLQDFQERQHELVQELREEIFSTPLRATTTSQGATLSVAGVIAETNVERSALNLGALKQNTALTRAAENKLNDMFEKQYFEHVSPEGNGPKYLAEQVGYNYIVIGENLALGNFKSDTALVDAWMASPGHKANILNTRFTEIGVAVGQGSYEGKKVWISVQEFGKPASDCPAINAILRASIDTHKAQVASMSKDLVARRQELKTMPQDTPADADAYNKKVDEYNKIVAHYNDVLGLLSKETTEYNKQVQAFNTCIKK